MKWDYTTPHTEGKGALFEGGGCNHKYTGWSFHVCQVHRQHFCLERWNPVGKLKVGGGNLSGNYLSPGKRCSIYPKQMGKWWEREEDKSVSHVLFTYLFFTWSCLIFLFDPMVYFKCIITISKPLKLGRIKINSVISFYSEASPLLWLSGIVTGVYRTG